MPRRRRPVAREGKDGYWHVWVSVGTKPNGRPDQRHIKRKDQEAAETAADELLDKIKSTGLVLKAGRKSTIQEWMTTYIDTIAPMRCTPNTLYDYNSKLCNWVYPKFGKLRVDKFGPEHLDAIYMDMKRAGKAQSHQLKVHRILSRGLDIAMRRGLVQVNVCKLVDPPSVDEARIVALEEKAAYAILDSVKGKHNEIRWSIALALGLRQGEAIGLRWQVDNVKLVDLDAGVLHVWYQVVRQIYRHGCGTAKGDVYPCARKRGAECPQRSGGGLTFKKTKGKSRRTLAIPAPLIPAFRAHRVAQAAERLKSEAAWPDHGLVFTHEETGRQIDPREDYDEWVAIVRSAGLPHAKLHIARHTAATMLLALGVDIRTVQKILGHRDIRTTQGYTQGADELMTEAVSTMSDRLFLRTTTKIKGVPKGVVQGGQ